MSYIQPAPKPNTVALWALVLGILALVLSVIAIGGVLGIAACVLGIIGITRPARKGMAITGLVAGVLAMPIALVALFFWVGFLTAFSSLSHARHQQAVAKISEIKTALERYELDVGAYPTTAEGLDALRVRPANADQWAGPYLHDQPVDPWGKLYQYRGPDATGEAGIYNLSSAGPDRVFGTADDVDGFSR
ncbi:MAG TPA: type II secretion system protein GspG [Phycisphaerae bacterium]|nr:type II secretion system protein GspG [Phycisphaerae bacterium]